MQVEQAKSTYLFVPYLTTVNFVPYLIMVNSAYHKSKMVNPHLIRISFTMQ